MINLISAENGIIERLPLQTMDKEVVDSARQKFDDLKQHGVLSGDFDSDTWIFRKDTAYRTELCFSHRRYEFLEICTKTGIEPDIFIFQLKIFIILRIGHGEGGVFRRFIIYVYDQFIGSNGFTTYDKILASNEYAYIYLEEFLNVVDGKSFKRGYLATEEYLAFIKSQIIEILRRDEAESDSPDSDDSHRLRLAQFRSYLIFDHWLRKAFKNDMSEAKKIYYFPLYLFWIITSIIPMRVTEFLVTPFNCISQSGGKYYLTIRRSRIKGNSMNRNSVRSYRIDTDYYFDTLEITKSLYETIEYYQANSKQYRPNDTNDLLFSREIYWSLSKELSYNTRSTDYLIITTKHFLQLLDSFYKEYLVDFYGFTIVSEDELRERFLTSTEGGHQLRSGEVMRITPRHTRHLAMVNLICRGASPSICMRFARHESTDMSEHYFGNIAEFLKCRIRFLYDISKGEPTMQNNENYLEHAQDVSQLSLMIPKDAPSIELDNGTCHSKTFLSGSPEDCLKCDGVCERCDYFRPYNLRSFTQDYSKEMSNLYNYVIDMLKNPEVEEKIESFHREMLQLESMNVSYTKELWNMFKSQEDSTDGQTD